MSRDISADTTLNNANMGTREDFEKWFAGEHGVPQNCHLFARSAYQFRQPEIDALKEELSKWVSIGQTRLEEVAGLKTERTKLNAENDRARKAYLEYEQENFLLKAENERLRFYEERSREKNEQIAKLSSEIDRLRKDAERYRFQNAHNFRFFPDSDQWEVVGFRGDLLACGGAETYESAIDAAMKDFLTEES